MFTDLSKWWGCRCAATVLCYYRSGSPRWAGHPQCVRLRACANSCHLLICAALSTSSERWLCSVCVALWCLCWRWDKMHVKRMQEDLEHTNHISVRQPQIRQGCLTESKTHCVFSRFEHQRRGASSKSDHRTADRSPESPQPSATIHSSAAPALPASPI